MKNLKSIWVIAIVLSLMPFMPEPHLWQKLKLLNAGYLKSPEDWFDLVWHSSGIIVAIVMTALKMFQKIRKKNEE